MAEHSGAVALGAAADLTARALPRRLESDDCYPAEIIREGRHRIIECADGIQWIIQKRDDKNKAGTRWRSNSYCTTRKALARLWGGLCGRDGPFPALDALPDIFPRRVGGVAS